MAKILNCYKVQGFLSETEGAEGMIYRQIIDKTPGKCPGITFNDIVPGGNTKDHKHDGIHITYVVHGHGQLKNGEDVCEINEGDLVYIEPFERHCFVNSGDETLTLLGLQGL